MILGDTYLDHKFLKFEVIFWFVFKLKLIYTNTKNTYKDSANEVFKNKTHRYR